jgi:hypothetical protein
VGSFGSGSELFVLLVVVVHQDCAARARVGEGELAVEDRVIYRQGDVGTRICLDVERCWAGGARALRNLYGSGDGVRGNGHCSVECVV